MKRELQRFMMRLAAITMGLCLFCGCLAKAQTKSDRERDELSGPVHIIRSEKILLSKLRDKSPDQKTEISQVTYNEKGNKIEEIKYKADGSLVSKSVFDYDADGNRTAEIVFSSDGSIYLKKTFTQKKTLAGAMVEDSTVTGSANPPTKTTYTYDRKGRPTELVAFGPDGKPQMRTVTKYRNDGKPTEIDFFEDYNTQTGKLLFIYDAKGNLRTQEDYGTDGSLISKLVFSGDTERGSDITMTEYDSKGNLVSKEHYVREFDSHGNWIKETKSKLNSESGNFELTETTQRQITYK